MKKLRPVFADRLALSLINRWQLAPPDFEARDGGTAWLSDAARRTVLTACQERKKEECRHDFVSDVVPFGRLPFVQAQLLSRHLRGDLDGYPAGNHFQLFHLEDNPNELVDLANDPSHAQTLASLKTLLLQQLYGDDLKAVNGETLVGLDVPDIVPGQNCGLSGQRGLHYPEPPPQDAEVVVGAM